MTYQKRCTSSRLSFQNVFTIYLRAHYALEKRSCLIIRFVLCFLFADFQAGIFLQCLMGTVTRQNEVLMHLNPTTFIFLCINAFNASQKREKVHPSFGLY